MAINANDVRDRVREQLGKFSYKPAREWMEARLVPPTAKELLFEYGNDEAFTAWIVAELWGDRIAVYCEGGFGALGSPWGVVSRDDSQFGMDAGWHIDLESLVLNGWVKAPAGWEVP